MRARVRNVEVPRFGKSALQLILTSTDSKFFLFFLNSQNNIYYLQSYLFDG